MKDELVVATNVVVAVQAGVSVRARLGSAQTDRRLLTERQEGHVGYNHVICTWHWRFICRRLVVWPFELDRHNLTH